MSITFGAYSTAVTGTGVNPVLSPTTPGGTAGNSIPFLVVTWKSSSIPTPLVATTGGGVWLPLYISDSAVDIASGVDTGSMTTAVWYVKGAAPTGTTVTFTGTVGACQATIGYYNVTAGNFWTLATTGGTDESYGSDYLATLDDASLGATAGDTIVVFNAVNTDAGPIGVGTLLSSGATYTVAGRLSSPSTTGEDSRMGCYDATVTGTQTGNDMTFGFTNANSSQGSTVAVRLREVPSPAVTITTIDNFSETAGYEISITGLTPFTSYEVVRDQGKEQQNVRGAFRQAVTADAVIYQDYEFHFQYADGQGSPKPNYIIKVTHSGGLEDERIYTKAQTPLQDWTASATSEAYGPKTYLSCPLIPALNIPVLIEEFSEYTRDGRVLSEAKVLGRSKPVVSIDVLDGRKGTFSMLVPTDAISGGEHVPQTVVPYTDLFATGDVYQLRILAPHQAAIDDFYFIVNTVAVSRKNRMVNMFEGDPAVVVTVTFTEVDGPPAEDVNPNVTWQDVLDNYQYNSWADVISWNPTWLDVLLTG